MLVLSGDIGGTSTRLQLTEFNGKEKKIIERASYTNAKHKSLIEIIQQFTLQVQINPSLLNAACFAVAGPIIEGTVKITNLPWSIEEIELKNILKLDSVTLINDFAAVAYGLSTLDNDDRYILQRGELVNEGTKAIIGAGTGLGIAIMNYQDDCYHVLSTEGGHIDFAPTDLSQIELLKYLLKKLHRVSIERVLSGQGIVNIYHFVRDNPLYGEEENPNLRLALHQDNHDSAALICEFATVHHDPMAMRTLTLFVEIYGAAAGNLALTTLPYGGLYIVGGIAPKLLAQLSDGRFMKAFGDKGRMSNLLHKVPITIVLDTYIGLQGAANYAFKQ